MVWDGPGGVERCMVYGVWCVVCGRGVSAVLPYAAEPTDLTPGPLGEGGAGGEGEDCPGGWIGRYLDTSIHRQTMDG